MGRDSWPNLKESHYLECLSVCPPTVVGIHGCAGRREKALESYDLSTRLLLVLLANRLSRLFVWYSSSF